MVDASNAEQFVRPSMYVPAGIAQALSLGFIFPDYTEGSTPQEIETPIFLQRAACELSEVFGKSWSFRHWSYFLLVGC